MSRRFPRLLLSLAAFLAVAAAADTARADVILLTGQSAPQGGVGKTPESVLSIQSPGSSDLARGGVAYGCQPGRRGVTCGDILSDDAKQGEHTKTLSFSQAGITNAGQLRIFMDIEDPDNDLFLHELVLTAYSSNGTVLFQGSFTDPQRFAELAGGQGHGDYVFGLDPFQAQLLQNAFRDNPDLRLGLFARTSDDTGSFTNFKLGQGAEPIPEPVTMILFGTGLAGIAAKVRRQKKASLRE